MHSTALSHLNKELIKLKLIKKSPRLWISEYFSNLITQVDLEFTILLYSENHSSETESNHQAMIKYINLHEKKCLINQETNHINNEELNCLLEDSIKKISTHIVSLTSKLDSELMYETENLLYKTRCKIESHLLLNKSFVFINKQTHCFLVIVDCEYYGNKEIEIIKKFNKF
jgi:hypothetical protein